MLVSPLIFRESEEECLLYLFRSTANLQFRCDGGGHGSRTDAPGAPSTLTPAPELPSPCGRSSSTGLTRSEDAIDWTQVA